MPEEVLNIATCYCLVPIFGLCYFFCFSTYDCMTALEKANSLRWPCPCLNEPIMCYWPQGHQEFPPESAIKNQTKLHVFPLLFNHIFLLMSWKYICVEKSIIWTNGKLSLIVAWSSSVFISCSKIQSFIGHLVWFSNSGNSIVSEGNSWCPCETSFYFYIIWLGC